MLSLIYNTAFRPNRLEGEKDTQYHIDHARWCVGSANTTKHAEHMNRIKTNKRFFVSNKQWGSAEDVWGFLKDQGGQDNSRIKVEYNLIQLMVNQLYGQAKRMSFKAKAHSYSPFIKSRKDKELERLLFLGDVGKFNPQLGEYIKQQYPIGKDSNETTQLFNNSYVDSFTKSINSLLRYSSRVNKFDKLKKELAEDLALSGMLILKPYIHSQDYRFRRVRADRFFWDRAAINYDLSDAGYMGEWDDYLPTELFEMFPDIPTTIKKAIEDFSGSMRASSFAASAAGRVRVYTTFWRDVARQEYGYVIDNYGDYFLALLDEDKKDDRHSFTIDDVVDASKLSDYQKGICGREKGKAVITIDNDQWRYCMFIPSENLSATYPTRVSDVPLAFGVVSFQEPDLYSSSNMKPPYKVNFHIYVDGDVYSPIDIAINPQRIANRILSSVENMINNSRGSGTVYDSDFVPDEAQFLKNMDSNKPVSVNSKGLGITNVIGKYDNTIGAGAMGMINIAQMFLTSIESITGVTAAMKGEAPEEQLVGVMQLMIQRGSITQERFFDALENVYLDAYQAIAGPGKRLYIQNKKKLVDIVGDDANVLTLSKELSLEDFRVDIVKTVDENTERKGVDQTVLSLMQFGFIDKERASKILGSGSEDDMWMAVREYVKEEKIVQKMVAEKQAQADQQYAQQMGNIAQRQEMNDLSVRVQDAVEKDKDRRSKELQSQQRIAGNLAIQEKRNEAAAEKSKQPTKRE